MNILQRDQAFNQSNPALATISRQRDLGHHQSPSQTVRKRAASGATHALFHAELSLDAEDLQSRREPQNGLAASAVPR